LGRAGPVGQTVNCNFEWDPEKATENRKKHGVTFEQAATAFRDPRALSLYDKEHSETEDRWITLGLSASAGLVVVHHTYEEQDEHTVRIRIVSSRKATRREIAQYSKEMR
jgi:hypothetical protein